VLTWRNSDEAVKVGAKPLEVEGLAKPMAARLMAMARPGQILLSAVAEPLAHRAARELGERGQHLLWKSHGRWRFKGLPDSQQIYEVGEPGVAPLRMPPNTPKAWRDIPLWRRPAALAAEAAIIAGIGVGVWFATRPAPAIAFNQRDWVVVADLRNLTGQSVLDDSLQQAFRISLEQSRHVNVLSDMKARDTLARMQLQPDVTIDRRVGSEIALRDGARAVILPTVSEVGGRLRVNVEVIDPATQGTVHSESVEGRGDAASALNSIDKVTAELRATLGETLKTIDKDSEPLPQVTTSSLDALRAYALGNKAASRGQWREAKDLYERAIALDPDFALAHAAIARAYVALSDRPSALPYLDRALNTKGRLTERDRLYLDAWSAELRLPGKALARWELLASLYPDQQAGPANASWQRYQINDFEAARKFAEAANLPQGLMQGVIVDQIGRVQLAQGKVDEAWKTFEKAERLQPGVSARRIASTLAVQERHDRALAAIGSMKESGFSSSDLVRYIDLATLNADRASWPDAERGLREGLSRSAAAPASLAREFAMIAMAVKLVQRPQDVREADLRTLAKQHLAALNAPDNPKASDDAFMALTAAYMAQRAGHAQLATEVLREVEAWKPRLSGTIFDKMLAIVEAEADRLAGRPEAAVRRLQAQLDGTELVQTHVALRAAWAAMGRHDEALSQASWLLDNRGRAYMEANAAQVLQTLNVLDTRMAHVYAAEALMGSERPTLAAKQVADLLRVWPRERLPDYLRRRTESILPASNANTTL
jgi:putative peptide modification system cyclase